MIWLIFFFERDLKLHGLPTTIVSDWGPIFTSHFWQQLFRAMGTKLTMYTAYHPQTDGRTERLNRCHESYLRSMVFSEPKQWVKWLLLAEWWYNTNHHSSLKFTPFQVLYGFIPPQIPLGSLPHSTHLHLRACGPTATNKREFGASPGSHKILRIPKLDS